MHLRRDKRTWKWHVCYPRRLSVLSRSNLKHVSVMRIPNNHPDKSIKAATSNSLSSTRIRILKKKK